MSADNKVERDLLGISGILGDLFGVPAVADAVRHAEKNIPKSRQSVASTAPAPAPGPDDAETLESCADCGTYFLREHDCPKRAETPKAQPAAEPSLFFCAFARTGKFLGAFASPFPACDAADKEDGFVKRLPKEKVPRT